MRKRNLGASHVPFLHAACQEEKGTRKCGPALNCTAVITSPADNEGTYD
jgi:hypothetical protein